jgi:hypothetical protein
MPQRLAATTHKKAPGGRRGVYLQRITVIMPIHTAPITGHSSVWQFMPLSLPLIEREARAMKARAKRAEYLSPDDARLFDRLWEGWLFYRDSQPPVYRLEMGQLLGFLASVPVGDA